MRGMLLSFQPRVFDLIRSGKKIFEYRYQFPNEPIRAYMYVSKPVQAIVGYLELDNRINILDWKEQYSYDSEISKRIDEYLARNNRYVMPIKKFVMTEPVELRKLNASLEKFIIPQSYYFLDTFPELKELINREIIETGEITINDFTIIKDKDICVRSYD